MAKRAKEKVIKKKENVKQKNKNQKIKNQENKVQKETKEEKFDFNEEIVIGLTRIDNPKQETRKDSKRKNKKTKDKTNKRNIVNNNKKNNAKKQIEKNKKELKKITKKEEIARKKRMAIFRVVKWTGLIVIIIAGIIYTLLSPLFNVKQIKVMGNSKISNDEVISLSRIQIGTNIFKYRMSEIENNIKQNTYIENVKVTRKLPSEIELIIEERKAEYMIQIGNAYAYIDNQGYILEISSKKLDVPILTENETLQENIQEGNRLCTEDLKKLNDVLKIMRSAHSNEIHDLITKINIKDPSNYILTLEGNKIVYFGDTSNLSPKMSWIIILNSENKDEKGIMFLNVNLNENRKPYFRKDI